MESNKIFISYAHANLDKALMIAECLKSESFEVWSDIFEIQESDNWLKAIIQGLNNASLLVVIWTKEASESEWVNRELLTADEKNISIIPLLFDGTPKHIVFQEIQPIDFRQRHSLALSTLVKAVARVVEENQIQADGPVNRPWRRLPDPTIKSRFLTDNFYADIAINSDNFGRNEWTKKLGEEQASDRKWVQASHFVSIVAVPVDRTYLTVDFNALNKYFGLRSSPNSGTRKIDPDRPLYRNFPINAFRDDKSYARDYVRFDLIPPPTKMNRLLYRFLRFSQGGAIEYADVKGMFQLEKNAWFEKNVWGVNYIGLVGLNWQLIHLMTEFYYDFLNYRGNIQLLVNLIGTTGALLGNFAGSLTNPIIAWRSPLTAFNHGNLSFEEIESMSCGSSNIQIVYQLDCEYFRQNEEVSREVVDDLGFELQRCFGIQRPNLYHYLRGTEGSFPWREYELTVWNT